MRGEARRGEARPGGGERKRCDASRTAFSEFSLEISVATEPKMTALRPQAIAIATHVKICPKQRQRF
jgi:hypothetical protein